MTFVNNNEKYKSLNDTLIKSVLEFTDCDIEVNSINFDITHPSDRVICKTINVKEENFATICYSKIFSSLTSEFDVGLQLDADMIVTSKAVELFDMIDENHQFIKASLHPQIQSFNYSHFETLRRVGGKQITQPYVHATYLFTKHSKSFLQEAFDRAMEMYESGFHPINFDETILNCLLWKYEKTDCFVDCYDLYYEHVKSLIGLSQRPIQSYSEIEGFKVNPYICHGCKDPKEAEEIFQFLANREKL